MARKSRNEVPPASRRRGLPARLEALLAEVAEVRLPALREIWQRELQQEQPPLRSHEVVRRMLAYRLQEAALGGLSAGARRRLAEIEVRRRGGEGKVLPPPPQLRPGVTLMREWRGVRHEVKVTAEGLLHQGKLYRSLSEAAQAITGTKWNGPKFFGLRAKPKEAA